MEQRTLLASALVVGCVAAAGAGGFLAVSQMAPNTPEPAAVVATEPEAAAANASEGTVAEITATEVTASATPAASTTGSGGDANPPSTSGAAPPQVERARTVPAARPAPAPASTPSSPSTVTRRDDAGSAPRSTPPASTRPSQDTPRPVATRSDDTTPSLWPSRDSGTAGDDRWATGDTNTTSTTADASLPSRSPISETAAPPAPVRRLETVTIPADAVVGIQIETGVSTTTARVEDPVRARVTRDLVSGGDVVIPAGARLLGNVTLVEEGGRVKERARLGIRFHTLVLANGTEVKLPTETIYREGESPAGKSAAKIGGAAVGGAILGAIMGGGKGAAIGAATGAGSGTGWAMAGDRRPAELRAGQALTVRISDSVTTQVQR